MEKVKISTARSMYAAIMDMDTGKLLLTRRTKTSSIIKGVSFFGCWELPGGAIMTSDEATIPYNYYFQELARIVEKNTGIRVPMVTMPRMYSLPFIGKDGYDEASVVYFSTDMKPTKGDSIYVSPEELLALAREFEAADEKTAKSGKGLLSGYGKRQYCLSLAALQHSFNQQYADQATKMLEEVTSSWPMDYPHLREKR